MPAAPSAPTAVAWIGTRWPAEIAPGDSFNGRLFQPNADGEQFAQGTILSFDDNDAAGNCPRCGELATASHRSEILIVIAPCGCEQIEFEFAQ